MTPAEIAQVERLYAEFRGMDEEDTPMRAYTLAHMVPRLVAEVKRVKVSMHELSAMNKAGEIFTGKASARAVSSPRVRWPYLLIGGILGMLAALAWGVVQ